MNEKPVLVTKLSGKGMFFYLLIGGVGSCIVGCWILSGSYPDYWSSIQGVLDLFTGLCFFLLSIYCFIQTTFKTQFHKDRIIWGTVLKRREIPISELSGFYSMDQSDLQRKGAFRGIILKKKNGQPISFHKGKLSDYESVLKFLRERINRFNYQSIQKMLTKENRKVYLRVAVLILLLVLSMLH